MIAAGGAIALSLLLSPAVGIPGGSRAEAADLADVQINDNRRAAGRLDGNTLTLALETGTGIWRFDGDDKPGVAMQALGEAGSALQIPSPMIRVPAGTEIRLSLRNKDGDGSLIMHGLYDRPAPGDTTITLAPGETREIRFRLSTPGTYYYWGSRSDKPMSARMGGLPARRRHRRRPAGHEAGPQGRDLRHHRMAGRLQDQRRAGLLGSACGDQRTLMAGQPAPHLYRGKAVKWRWINASMEDHPLHLHGFYFRVDSRGDGLSDRLYPAGPERDWVVTEQVMTGETITTTWIPTQPGNWIFHCHNPYHMRQHFPFEMLQSKAFPLRAAPEFFTALAATREMAGMVLGVTVRPKEGPRYNPRTPEGRRKIDMTVEATPESTDQVPSLRYVVNEDRRPEVLSRAAGPLLVLTKGEPTQVTIKNRMKDMTTVHWHGIELESYFDGVGEFGGDPKRGRSPMIHPGHEFVARFTPPRAGTFMYHTHMVEAEQGEGGLNGPIVVLEPGQKYDPARDHVILVTPARSFADQGRFLLVNGVNPPEPIEIVAGQKHRFRFINLHTFEGGLVAEVKQGATLGLWRALAKDGRDLPRSRQVDKPARQMVSIGETYDFEFVAGAPGDYKLELSNPRFNKLWTTIPLNVVATPTRRAELMQPTGTPPPAAGWRTMLASLLPTWSTAGDSTVQPLPSADGFFEAACVPQPRS
jgi:FtsP/CotA-like multicopper oxidase with cupredoxin domain